MNYYEKLILAGAMPVVVLLGWFWGPLRLLMLGVTAASVQLLAPGVAAHTFPSANAARSVLDHMQDAAQLDAAIQSLHGQLTATLIGEPEDLQQFGGLTPLLEQKVGRILINGYPTGVEVCDAMVHGGPYPATSDARGTSVGTLAIDRFLRPVCFQNYPDSLLPEPLKNANPLGIQRLVDGQTTRNPL